MNRANHQHIATPLNHSRRWWRSLLFGYPATLVLAACAFLIPWFETASGIRNFFIASPFVLVTLLIGWLWGIGPAFLALVAETLALDYWIVPPLGNISFFLWPNIASFGPFILLQLLALGLVLRQKRYRHQLILSTQALSRYVEELTEINTQLEEANRSRDTFVSQASHELKTPLASLQGVVQLTLRRLLREPPLPPNLAFLQSNLERIDLQTRRLHTLVDDLLSLNYLRTGSVPLRLASCDLAQLCRESVEDLGFVADHTVDLQLPAHPVVIQADKERLYQVVLNLITNALKYSPTHATIRVKVSTAPQEAILAVWNEGSFLPEEQRAHIFEPFYRAPDVRYSANLGWGLGLTISKQLVEQHGGRIWVESFERQGTTFFVAFPFTSSSAL